MPELAEVETPKTAGFVDRGYNYEKKQQANGSGRRGDS